MTSDPLIFASAADLREWTTSTSTAPKWASAAHHFVRTWFDSGDAITTHTSGSTGSPKVITLRKAHLSASARMTLNYLQLTSPGMMHCCLPAETIAGQMMIVRALTGNLGLHLSPATAPVWHSDLPSRLTLGALVPPQVEHLLALDHSEQAQAILHRYDRLLIGGGPLAHHLEDWLLTHKRADQNIFHTYGMTETMSHVALRPLGTAAFTCLAGVSVSLNQHRLQIHAPHLGVEHLLTTDLATLTSPTAFTIHGRSDFIINSGGVKVQPEVVEQIIRSLYPSVNAIVTGTPDPSLGSQVTMVIEGDHGLPVSWDQAREAIRAAAPAYHAPRAYVCMPRFPRSESGKILRPAVQAYAEAHLSTDA